MVNFVLGSLFQDISNSKLYFMKNQFLTTLFTLITSLCFSQSFNIDNENAIVDFNFVSEETIGTVKGIKGSITFDPNDLGNATISGTADVTTLSTENKTRDNHLQQEEMFNAAKFPTMSFKSSSINKTEKGFSMIGELGIKGFEHQITIFFTYDKNVFTGQTVIFSNDYNVFSKKKREDSKVLIKITIPVI